MKMKKFHEFLRCGLFGCLLACDCLRYGVDEYLTAAYFNLRSARPPALLFLELCQ